MRYGFVARVRSCTAALVLAGLSSFALAGPASAETYNVSTTLQFEEAVSKANASAVANTIVLKGGVAYLPTTTETFTNTSGLLTIEGPSGPPSQKLETAKLDGGAVLPFPSELFVVQGGVSVTFKNVDITHGGGSGTPTIEDFGSLGIESSAVAGNTGAGVVVQPGATITVRNSTFSDGLDFGVVDDGTASFFNSTVAFNKNGGIENKGTLNLTNTIVAQNTGSGDCEGKATTSDHSLDSNGSCGVGLLSKTNPLLQTSLLIDGGSTPLHSLKPGSPAIDAGDPAKCPITDQRGAPRPDVPGTACDIGADEYNATAPTIRVPAEITEGATSSEGAVVTYNAEATDSNDIVCSFSCTPASGSTFAIGTTEVKCTATSGHETTATASFKVAVLSCAPEHLEGFCTSFTAENTEGSFNAPEEAVAVDSSANIWVGDSGHDRVVELNSAHTFLRQFGTEGTGEGQFEGIHGIATNSSGNVYVTGSNRVQEFSPTGTFLRKWGSSGTGNGQFIYPSGIAVDSSGNVWVLDFSGRVQEFSATGEFLSVFGSRGTGAGQLGLAFGLAPSRAETYTSRNSPTTECRSSLPPARSSHSSARQEQALASSTGPGASPQTRLRATSTSAISSTTARRSSAPQAPSSPPSALSAPARDSSQSRGEWLSAPPAATSISQTQPTTGSRNGYRCPRADLALTTPPRLLRGGEMSG